MKTFLAIYTATGDKVAKSRELDGAAQAKRDEAGMAAWMKWGTDHAASIIDNGAPLGKTKLVNKDGISDIKNAMTGYVLVRAESHAEAAKMFENHPHFTIFLGDGVEIMECLPLPEM